LFRIHINSFIIIIIFSERPIMLAFLKRHHISYLNLVKENKKIQKDQLRQ